MMYTKKKMMMVFFLARLLCGQIAAAQLQSVQIIFRHGQRSPVYYYNFPTDPVEIITNTSLFPYELGEMTNTGIGQLFRLGQILNEQYGDMLGDGYVPTKLYAVSGIENRTIVSALSMLAGMLPPDQNTATQIWNDDHLVWQPIPVHTDEYLDHPSFGVFDYCPSIAATVYGSVEFANANNNHRELMDLLENRTGMPINDIVMLNRVLDTLKIRHGMSDVLPLQLWARNESFMKMIIDTSAQLHKELLNISIVTESTGGWMFGQLIDNFRYRINNQTANRIRFYSAHDSNIITLAHILQLADVEYGLASFGAYLSFELHSEEIIKIYYHPELNKSAIPISIPNCVDPCHFSTFAQLFKSIDSRQYASICYGHELIDCQNYFVYFVIVAGLLLLVLIIWLITIFVCLHLRSQLDRITNGERRPLLERKQSNTTHRTIVTIQS